jgi:hypothetical protein
VDQAGESKYQHSVRDGASVRVACVATQTMPKLIYAYNIIIVMYQHWSSLPREIMMATEQQRSLIIGRGGIGNIRTLVFHWQILIIAPRDLLDVAGTQAEQIKATVCSMVRFKKRVVAM